MNYEEKYKEALERAKRLHGEPTGGTERIVCEQIFPELNESYGEKIRKELIEHIKANKGSDFVLFKRFSPDDVIAWLEKQGVQKSIEPLKLSDIDKAMVESRIVEDLVIMRACEWLRCRLPLTNLDEFINGFKIAMKGD